MTRIVTVLRTGGEYAPAHVLRLEAQCARFAPAAEFVCLSDDPDAPRRIPLLHDWPGWWSKIEAFRLPGPCLYLDLDTTLVGPIDDLLALAGRAPFIALRDFNWPARELQSSVMGWAGDQSALYRRFADNPAAHMAENASPRWWGDQGFLERRVRRLAYWQDVAPGRLVSFKKDCGAGVPVRAAVVVYHGRPRPWDVEGRARGAA